jgi:hypothetical protein
MRRTAAGSAALWEQRCEQLCGKKEKAMENRFDELAKAVAGGISRREALRRVGGGLIAALLAPLGVGKAWAVPGMGGERGRGEGCGVSCQRIGLTPGSDPFVDCTEACEACKDEGGTPCFGGVDNVDCCVDSESCEEGVCVPPCLEVGESCEAAPEGCCDDLLCEGKSGSRKCCADLGIDCEVGTDCCSGSCVAGSCCLPSNIRCTENSQCCSGSCSVPNPKGGFVCA